MAAEAGEVDAQEPASDADREPADVARAAELLAHDEDWERLEEAGLLLVSLARIKRDIEQQQEVRD